MHVRISDQKMKDMLHLINSIPLPQKSSAQSPERQVNGDNKNAKYLYICIYGDFFSSFCELFCFSVLFRASFLYLIHF